MFLFIGWFVLEFNHSAPVKDSTLCYIFFNINGFCLGSRHTWPKKPTLSRFGEFFPLSDHPLSMHHCDSFSYWLKAVRLILWELFDKKTYLSIQPHDWRNIVSISKDTETMLCLTIRTWKLLCKSVMP